MVFANVKYKILEKHEPDEVPNIKGKGSFRKIVRHFSAKIQIFFCKAKQTKKHKPFSDCTEKRILCIRAEKYICM